ncbi:MAG: FliM/FliN family flagellar motor C-terminal domain-containing protein [Chlamydiales bacterium]
MRVDEIPWQASVILGQTTLPMAACLELQEGDVLILDQKIDEPLSVQVGEQTPLHGFGGLVHTRKGIKIA